MIRLIFLYNKKININIIMNSEVINSEVINNKINKYTTKLMHSPYNQYYSDKIQYYKMINGGGYTIQT